MENGTNFGGLTVLEELVLDKNGIQKLVSYPVMATGTVLFDAVPVLCDNDAFIVLYGNLTTRNHTYHTYTYAIHLLAVRTLWLNKNSLQELDLTLATIQTCFPSLTYAVITP